MCVNDTNLEMTGKDHRTLWHIKYLSALMMQPSYTVLSHMLVILHLDLKSNVQRFQKFGLGESSENAWGMWFSMDGCAGSWLGLLSWPVCTGAPCTDQWPWLPVSSSDLGLSTHSLELVLVVSCGGGHSDCPSPQHKYNHLGVFRENGGVLLSGSVAPSLLHSPNLQHTWAQVMSLLWHPLYRWLFQAAQSLPNDRTMGPCSSLLRGQLDST